MFGVSKPNKYNTSRFMLGINHVVYILASKLHTSRVPHNKTLALVDVSTHQAHSLKAVNKIFMYILAKLEYMCACQYDLPNNFVDFKVTS